MHKFVQKKTDTNFFFMFGSVYVWNSMYCMCVSVCIWLNNNATYKVSLWNKQAVRNRPMGIPCYNKRVIYQQQYTCKLYIVYLYTLIPI